MYAFFDWSQERFTILKLSEIAARKGCPFIVREFLYPHLSRYNQEIFLKESLENCRSDKFKKEFMAFSQLKKINSQSLIDMYEIRPDIVEWINFASYHWTLDGKMEFINFVVETGRQRGVILSCYEDLKRGGRWIRSALFLEKLLDSPILIKALKCPVHGTVLSSFINDRCWWQNRVSTYDRLILELIRRGMGVNEDTPIGKPLNHFLYMLSGQMRRLDADEKEKSMAIVDAFLIQYDKVESAIGVSLNPRMAERMHHGARASKIEEYMQTVLGSTLQFDCPSRELYDRIKWIVDLEEVNSHRRNFVHHLAFLEDCLEGRFAKFVLMRGYSGDNRGKLIDLQDGDGLTPLMYATHNPEFFHQLLACGADVTLTDKRGFTVDHHLMIHGTDAVIKKFLEWKNIPFLSDECGATLKRKLGVRMDERLILDVTFDAQLKELCRPRKTLASRECSRTSHLNILSTHSQFSLRLKEGVLALVKSIDSYRDPLRLKTDFLSQEEKEEERGGDQDIRAFLSTGDGILSL